jgi:MFS family permease
MPGHERGDVTATGSRYALGVLFAINFLNFFDRQMIGVLSEPIRREWNLSDTALGGAGTAFILLYALAGVPLGRLADRSSRPRMLAAGVVAWSLLTAATGAAWSYASLLACRLGVGVGEASCAPAASSLIGDLFPAQKRARAMSIFMLGLPLGLASSFAVGGAVAHTLGWRWAFYLAAVPGLVCALAVLRIQDPGRGATEAFAIGDRRREGSPYRLVLATPTVVWIILSGALHNFSMYAFSSFLAPYLMRYHGLGIRPAGFMGMAVSLAGILGLLVGGLAGDALAKRRADGRLLVAAISAGTASPLMWWALQQPQGHVVAFALVAALGYASMQAYYSVVYSALHDVIEPALRGTAMALYFFAMYVLGGALGPLLTGAVSDHFAKAVATTGGDPAFAIAEGLRLAMHLIPALAIVLTAVLFAASRTAPRDMRRLREWMQASTAKG